MRTMSKWLPTIFRHRCGEIPMSSAHLHAAEYALEDRNIDYQTEV